MALKVTTSPTYTGKLKVVATPPRPKLKVTTKPVSYVTPKTVNPQKSVSPQPRTYNPQQTAPAKVLQNKQSDTWAKQQAQALIAQRDAQILQQRLVAKRLADAKNKQINTSASGWFSTLKDKATFGQDRRNISSQSEALKYFNQNQQTWRPYIEAMGRQFERDNASWNTKIINATSEAEFNRLVSEYDDWYKRSAEAYDSQVKDYNKEQAGLEAFSGKPLTTGITKALSLGRDTMTGIAGTGWKALTKISETPERLVNTAKNFVNPNNLRMYYGGEEKKGGITGQGSNPVNTAWDQLKKSYNASDQQRIAGFSKEDEANRLAGGKPFQYKDYKTGEIKTGYTKPADGVNEFRIKYGDDVANFVADPLNFLPNNWLEKGGSKASKFLSKSKTFNKLKKLGNFDIGKKFEKNVVGKAFKWLGSESVTGSQKRSAKISDYVQDLADVNKTYQKNKGKAFNDFKKILANQDTAQSRRILKSNTKMRRLFDEQMAFTQKAKKISQDFITRLEDFSDTDVRYMTKYSRNGEWSRGALRNLTPEKRRQLTDFIKDYNYRAKDLADADGMKAVSRARNYLPHQQAGKRPYDFTQKRTLFGRKYKGQGRQGLQESIVMREFNSNYDEANSALKKLSQIERSILETAGKNKRALTAFETEKLNTLATRKKVLQKITKEFTAKSDEIQSNIAKLKTYQKPLIGKRGFNFTRGGVRNSAERLAKAPMNLWRKSVLATNPSWWVNNIGTNIPFSISAGGAGVIPEYAKMIKKKNRIFSGLPKGVTGGMDDFIGGGRLARGASKVEDISRVATFRALKKQGFSDEKAIRDLNRWLIDYTTKNYERPIKAISPFYKWQANMLRQSVQMPFTRPRSAKVYSEFQKQFFDRPLDRLPNTTQEYEDRATGEKTSFNPRDAYKGKMYTGKDNEGRDVFRGVPMWAMNPETLLEFGINPYLDASTDYFTGKDKFGNTTRDKNGFQILAGKFPQANLANKYIKRNDKNEQYWFTESGSSKYQQGQDPDAENYKAGLDAKRAFNRQRNSFLGGSFLNTTKFDRAEYEKKFKLSEFNKEFFSKDWDTIYKDEGYEESRKQQEEIAKKYGFDYQKDIIDDYWTKYDTATTTRTKGKKEEARQWTDRFWNDYFEQEAGSRTKASKRRPYLIEKYREWQRDNPFAENGQINIPKFSVYDNDQKDTGIDKIKNPFTLENEQNRSEARRAEGKRKYQRYLEYQKATKSGDWSWFEKNGRTKKSSPYQYDGKFFKSQESMDKYKTGSLWREYYTLKTLPEKQAFLDKHPELRSFEQPETQEEWDAVKALLKKQRNEKLAGVSGFTATRADMKKRIESSLPSGFGRGKRLKYKF